jgi:hypothetical protein
MLKMEATFTFTLTPEEATYLAANGDVIAAGQLSANDLVRTILRRRILSAIEETEGTQVATDCDAGIHRKLAR